jgi:hypothetical protein
MVNPVFTIFIDLALAGSALGIAAAMVTEAWVARRRQVGARRTARAASFSGTHRASRQVRLPYATGRRRVA